MKEYLEHWYEGKSEYLLKLFNNQLIIKEPVEFFEPFESIEKKISEVIKSPSWEDAIISPLTEILEAILFDGETYMKAVSYFHAERSTHWQQEHEEEKRFFIAFINTLRDPLRFAKNEIRHHLSLSPSPSNHLIKHFQCNYDTRPFKMIRSFVKIAEPTCRKLFPGEFTDYFFSNLYDNIEAYRIWHSQCLNGKKITGTLCLSIHPLDYLTMSDNGYGWHSCLNWTQEKPGEFRVGALEMMTSPYVVIAYLQGDKEWFPCGADRVGWNNKKWRQLFIVHPDVIAGIKGYPYKNENLTRVVLNKLKEMCGGTYGDIYDTYDTGCKYQDKYLYFYTNGMYNDTDCNDFLYMISTTPDDGLFDEVRVDEVSLNYSGPLYCLECGSQYLLDNNSDDCSGLTCHDCDTRIHCHECHAVIHRNEPAFDIGGEYYCSDCAEDLGYFDQFENLDEKKKISYNLITKYERKF